MVCIGIVNITNFYDCTLDSLTLSLCNCFCVDVVVFHIGFTPKIEKDMYRNILCNDAVRGNRQSNQYAHLITYTEIYYIYPWMYRPKRCISILFMGTVRIWAKKNSSFILFWRNQLTGNNIAYGHMNNLSTVFTSFDHPIYIQFKLKKKRKK